MDSNHHQKIYVEKAPLIDKAADGRFGLSLKERWFHVSRLVDPLSQVLDLRTLSKVIAL